MSDDEKATTTDAPKAKRGWVHFTLTRALPALAIVFVLMQFVPYRVDSPSTRDEPKWDSPQTRALAVRACYDCHSNQPQKPLYTRVAPTSWIAANHVKEGRASLNFSEWHTAAGEAANEAAEPAAEGSMPPGYYYWLGLHGKTKLTAAETQQLVDGLNATAAADPPTGGGGG